MKHIFIVANIIIAITVNPTNLYALPGIDTCTRAGVTTGATCYEGSYSGTIIVHNTDCTNAESGCTFKACTNNCFCTNLACPSSGSTTNCSDYDCALIWGTPDSDHVQSADIYQPDSTDNCICKKDNSGINSTAYRCESGYYDPRTGMILIGSRPNNCIQCPTLGNNNVAGQSNTGNTENALNRGITSCYIPYNTEITDETGTYIFSNNFPTVSSGCKWKE